MLNVTPVFLHNWSSQEEVFKDFEYYWYSDQSDKPKIENKENIQVLFASYGTDNYSGDAFVLYYDIEQDKLFEVNGGHCSCYGLEGQWEPEEVTVKDLRFRLENGSWGRDDWSGNEFADELIEFLNKHEGELV